MKRLLPFCLTLCLALSLQARHIIGGVITYECLGNGRYLFTMKMYRDCYDPNGAFFDDPAPIAVYEDGNPTPLDTLFIPLQSFTDIEPDAPDPCLILPPNVCVQEGIYVFEYQFENWPNETSYHLSYQRCCRNATVTNIQTPDEVGATFTVEITPRSQELCNNSPTYETFPPIVICGNEPLMFNHQATDPDGDQLIYEMCEPLIGGGRNFQNPNACNGITPLPPCPPPYQPVQYISPPYNVLFPMGGDPPVTIDPVTGILSGTPNVLGQFSVAVCVSEFRNGELLSVIRRDFQFNVANCEPTVEAQLTSPNAQVIGDSVFIQSCQDLRLLIENNSIDRDFINDYRWVLHLDNGDTVVHDWNLDFVFPSTGVYSGQLQLNPGGDCGDTAFLHIEIFPELVPQFDFDYDTCVAGPVTFIDNSYIEGPGRIRAWHWDFGDGDTSTLQVPAHVYAEPKGYPVTLTITDEHGCENQITRVVNWRPAPALLIVSPNDTVSCAPATVLFNNLSNPIDNTYEVFWDFGDGNTGTAISPIHTYRQAGLFDVQLSVTSPIGCRIDTVFEALIEILPAPVADFSYAPTHPSNLEPLVHFTDRSIDAVHWDWYLDGQIFSQSQHPSLAFPDTGLHEIMLVITHPEFCLDTLIQVVDVEPQTLLHLPNAFTPNEDAVNELFLPAGILPGITDYRMRIYDRWGRLVFESSDPRQGWNGRYQNTGRPAPAGVYVVLVSYTGPRGEKAERKGLVTLLR